MDFFIFDNIETYNKRFPFNGIESTRLDVNQIYLPDTGAFWFSTNFNKIETNVNLRERYLHIHAGLTQFENMQFDKDPLSVQRDQLFYNPDTKSIEVVLPKSFFRHEIIFKKIGKYLGQKLPERKINVVGNIIYNFNLKEMYFVLNYFPNNKKYTFTWEDEPEPSTMEDRVVKELKEEGKLPKYPIIS